LQKYLQEPIFLMKLKG